MASDAGAVLFLLRDLAARAKPAAEQEIAALADYAAQRLGIRSAALGHRLCRRTDAAGLYAVDAAGGARPFSGRARPGWVGAPARIGCSASA
ncbi:hypothetical protein ACRAWD_22215 [Caulobacter segnis]